MFGFMDQSWSQRLTIIAGECIMILFVYWFLFMNGNELFALPAGNYSRNIVLFTFCLITFIRMSYMVVYLLKRGIKWGEVLGVVVAFAIYYVGFSVLGSIHDTPLDWVDGVAVLIFLIGSAINTVSELLRNEWKKDSQNKGKLYTGGLFKYAIHINYFGDIVWVSGFALLTRNLWSVPVPVFLFLMFILQYIPEHDRYLRTRYGEAFAAYEKKTKKFIPFIY